MSVVGFDLGNLSCYIAVARQGGIETVANEYSDRCTMTCVALGEKERSMGLAANNQIMINTKNTITNFKRLIGKFFKDPVIQGELSKSYFETKELTDGRIGAVMSYQGEQHDFTVQQLTAMQLTKLKQITESQLRTKIYDCVISVPSYFTDSERRSLLEACQIAGLNCLRLLNDTTATAITYGFYKKDLPTEQETPRNVVYIDFGHSALQVALVAHNDGKLKVLATAHDSSLGGHDFDQRLAHHFCEEFKTKYKINAASKMKPWLRLLQQCEKVKKLMSANSEKMPLNIECLMDDKDVVGHIDRATMEDLCGDLLARIEAPLLSVLEQTGLGNVDIHSVEIVGGSTRVPAVKSIIKQIYNVTDVSTTLNRDESVARGCALMCAMISPAFRSREFTVIDAVPYPISLRWGPAPDSVAEIFTRNHAFPFTKQMTFYEKNPFDLQLSYTNSEQFYTPLIGDFTIDKVGPQSDGSDSKVKVKVRFNPHGIVSVETAVMVEKLKPEESVEQMDTADDDTKQATPVDMATDDPQQNGDAAATEEGGESTQTIPSPSQDEPPLGEGVEATSNDDTSNTNNQPSTETDKPEKSPKKKSKTTVKTVDLPIISHVPVMDRQQMETAIEAELKMIMNDKLERERCEAKNSLEEYVYDMRDKLYSNLEQFVSESDRSLFAQQLETTETWLYEDGEDVSKQIYIDKLNELKKLGTPIITRAKENMDRPVACEDFGRTIQRFRKIFDLYQNKDEQYSHLDSKDMEKAQKLVNDKLQWFTEKMTLQTKTALTQNVVLTTSAIYTELKIVESFCQPIVNKPKPKVEPPKDDKASAGGKGDEGDGVNVDPLPAQSETETDEPATTTNNSTSNTNEMEVD